VVCFSVNPTIPNIPIAFQKLHSVTFRTVSLVLP
jgi:hypothetical protein